MLVANLVAWVKTLITHGNLKVFYNSAAWEHLRQEVLDEQHHECQICREKGLYSEAEAVHHIKPVRTRPDLALTKSNLLAVCNQCHYEIHHTRAHHQQLNEERW